MACTIAVARRGRAQLVERRLRLLFFFRTGRCSCGQRWPCPDSIGWPETVPAEWTRRTPLTPIDRFVGFSHTADVQLPDHLRDFEAMGLVGQPTSVDGKTPPFGGSHRLTTSAASTDGHSSTKAGTSSPLAADGTFLFDPVWRYAYDVR